MLDRVTGKFVYAVPTVEGIHWTTGSGINASPVTYEIAGSQYAAILSGLGGDLGFYFSGPKGNRLFVFALDNPTAAQAGKGRFDVLEIEGALTPVPR